MLTNATKTFTAIFLLFLYVAVSSKVALHFGEQQMIAGPAVLVFYTLALSLLIAVTWGMAEENGER